MKILVITQNQEKRDLTSITQSFIRGFKLNGEEVSFFDFSYTFNKVINYLFKRCKLLNRLILNRRNKQLVDFLNSSRIDLLFVVKGTHLLPQSMRAIKKSNPNIVIFGFNPDDPFNKDSWLSSNDNILKCLPEFDAFFIWKKDLVIKLSDYISKPVFYLPFACDKSLIPNLIQEESLQKRRIVFVGNSDPKRRRIVYEAGKYLNSITDNIKIYAYGNGWENSVGVIANGQARGDDYFRTIQGSIVNINVLREQNEESNNMRTFELPSSMVFQIHENSKEVRDLFSYKDSMVFFNSPTDMIDKALFYMNNKELRQNILINSHKLVLEEHTYEQRCKFILAAYKNIQQKKS